MMLPPLLLHKKRYVPPESVTVIFLGKRVFDDVLKLRVFRWDHSGLFEWALNLVICVSKRQKRHTRRRPWEDKGRYWSVIATRNWKRQGKTLLYGLQRDCGSANIYISELWPLGLWDSKFLLLSTTQFVVIWYGSTRKLVQSVLSMYIHLNSYSFD